MTAVAGTRWCDLCGRAIRRHQSCLSYGPGRDRHYTCADRAETAASAGRCPLVTHTGTGPVRCRFVGDRLEVRRHVNDGPHADSGGGLTGRSWVLLPVGDPAAFDHDPTSGS